MMGEMVSLEQYQDTQNILWKEYLRSKMDRSQLAKHIE